MGVHKHRYRIFNIIIAVVLIVAYFVIEYYVIPEHVHADKKSMAASYSSYALTGALAFLAIGSMVAEHFDELEALKKVGKK
jgi:hypothetical protein